MIFQDPANGRNETKICTGQRTFYGAFKKKIVKQEVICHVANLNKLRNLQALMIFIA